MRLASVLFLGFAWFLAAASGDGSTPLHSAAYKDDLDAVNELIQKRRGRQSRESIRRNTAVLGLHKRQCGHESSCC